MARTIRAEELRIVNSKYCLIVRYTQSTSDYISAQENVKKPYLFT